MFEKILNIVAAVRAGEWKKAVKLILEQLLAEVDKLDGPLNMTATSRQSVEDCCYTMERLANIPPDAVNASKLRDFLPILLDLLRRLLG